MEVTVTSPESLKKVLEIEAEYKEFNTKFEQAYQKYQKTVSLPGFRKGKVPLSLIKNRYQDAIDSEVLPDIISELYKKALKQENIEPINQAKIEELTYDKEKKIKFKAEVEIKPAIEIKDYKGIKVIKNKVKVATQEVDDYIKYLQENNAEIIQLERSAKNTDYIVAEFQELDKSGVPIIGNKIEKREYKVGSGLFGLEFDKKLEGINKDDEKVIHSKIPEDYENKNIAGNEVHFQVKVFELYEKKLPEIDDEFAKDLGSDSFKQLKEKVEVELTKTRENQEKSRIQNEILQEIVKRNTIDVPHSMLDNYLNAMMREKKQKSPDLDEQQFKEQNKTPAEEQIKEHMVIDEIARMENISVDDQDIDNYITEISGGNENTKKQMNNYFQKPQNKNRLKDELGAKKVLEFLES